MSISFPLPANAHWASRPHAAAARRTWPWERLGLVAVLLLAAGLELWHLDRLGTSNAFYAAAVLSMLQNWHAFFFNSLDSTGFVTIDKPPLGFWVQVASARLLGFSGVSILLPEALATVGSVALVYHLVKRAFGGVAGLLAGLMLALVPISVVVGRNNTIDALLVLTLLLAVWTGLRATERGSLAWLLATGALVGLGFEIKMLEAYLVVPALGLVYLLGAPVSWRARVGHLTLAAAVMLVVSLAWPVAVDLTPANLRPWIDSTQDNSAISLALGYNGIERLLGQNRSLDQFLAGSSSGPGGPGGMFNNGPAGVFRLFDQQLAGQASWLLPLSLVGLALGTWQAVRDRARSRQAQAAIVWGGWLLTAGAFFSVASFFHSYYLVTLGPPVAALAASGVWYAWRAFRRGSRLVWLLPAALLGTGLVQAHILASYPTWSRWLAPIAIGGPALGTLAIVATLVGQRLHRPLGKGLRLPRLATGVAVAALLVTPAVWSGYSTLYGSGGGLPEAGPRAASANVGPGGFDDPTRAGQFAPPAGGMPGGFGPGNVSASVVSFLETSQGSATYLAATLDSNTAASLILASNEPVMSLGGFTGSDPILTTDQFASLVASGQVRYVLLGGGGGPGRPGASGIAQWVQAHGTPVSAADLGASQTQLYDLAGAAA